MTLEFYNDTHKDRHQAVRERRSKNVTKIRVGKTLFAHINNKVQLLHVHTAGLKKPSTTDKEAPDTQKWVVTHSTERIRVDKIY